MPDVREKVDCVVVIPVGPQVSYDFALDTVDSVGHYLSPSHKILLLDNSGEDMGRRIQMARPSVVSLNYGEPVGLLGGFYGLVADGLRCALKYYDFKVVLRMDMDALVTGYGLDEQAALYFERNPRCAVIGSWRFVCNGSPRDFSWARKRLSQIISSSSTWEPVAYRKGHLWRKLIKRAVQNGYELGDHCLGGAAFLSRTFIERLAEERALEDPRFREQALGEDHILGLLAYVVGMELGDFSTGSGPMALAWRGLPMAPAELTARGKKIIHSTRFWGGMNESEIRTFFRGVRKEQSVLSAQA